jgi:hypothetical protein
MNYFGRELKRETGLGIEIIKSEFRVTQSELGIASGIMRVEM